VSAEALLRRDNSRLQQQLMKKDAEIKDLKRQVEEAGNLWKTTVAELSAAAEFKPRCELLEKEVEALKAEVQAAGCRVEEMERNCSSMVDLLLTVKEHVTAAGACAQDAAQFLKGEMSTFFKDDGDTGQSTADGKADAVHGEAMMATFEQLQGALQFMLESPTVGELLKSISNAPRQLAGIGETAKQLGKQLNEHQKAVHQRYFKIFEVISLIVRALDRASYELQGNRPLEFPTPATGPTVSSSVPPHFAPTASAATQVSGCCALLHHHHHPKRHYSCCDCCYRHLSQASPLTLMLAVMSKNDASSAQANAGVAAAAANEAATSVSAKADSGEAMQRTLQVWPSHASHLISCPCSIVVLTSGPI
jgi:hypothetical protein